MIQKNLEIKLPIRAKVTPVVGVREVAPLHRSLLQAHTPGSCPQSISKLDWPHPLIISPESMKQGIRKI